MLRVMKPDRLPPLFGGPHEVLSCGWIYSTRLRLK
jgi:hypothetical protein